MLAVVAPVHGSVWAPMAAAPILVANIPAPVSLMAAVAAVPTPVLLAPQAATTPDHVEAAKLGAVLARVADQPQAAHWPTQHAAACVGVHRSVEGLAMAVSRRAAGSARLLADRAQWRGVMTVAPVVRPLSVHAVPLIALERLAVHAVPRQLPVTPDR